MKNRKSLYILIPLVALIWGVVIWRVIEYQPSDQDTMHLALSDAEELDADTIRYELSFGYRDPFLRAASRSTSTISSGKNIKSNNIKNVDLATDSPVTKPANLVYHGEVSGHRRELGLIELEGKKVLVSEQSLVGEYTILSVETDSLVISYRDKRFIYGKQ